MQESIIPKCDSVLNTASFGGACAIEIHCICSWIRGITDVYSASLLQYPCAATLARVSWSGFDLYAFELLDFYH